MHQDYIRAGADVITANTFAANHLIMGPAGLGDQLETVNRRAVEIAREAREAAAGDRAVAVAGSISHMVRVVAGTDYRATDGIPPTDVVRANYREQAAILADAGVELIMMEMMSDPDLAVPAIEAAVGTGLPVWVGMSCRAGGRRRLLRPHRSAFRPSCARDRVGRG